MDFSELEKKLGYRFKSRAYLERAMIHRSFRFEEDAGDQDNQRLEFLGDAVLGLLAADYLFTSFPDMREGRLTRLRSSLANGRTLARMGARWKLGDYLLLGKGEKKSGGCYRQSNLADSLEALLGAIYIDGGLDAVRSVFERHFVPELERMLDTSWQTNPKGALQEYAQSHWKTSPRYRVIRDVGPAHCKRFTSEVLLRGICYGTGEGNSKQESEILAAIAAMERLIEEDHCDRDADGSS